MKRTIYLFVSLLFLIWGCEPMEDTYEELDKAEGAFSKNIEVTLEEGDYSSISDIALKLGDEGAADFIDENHAFSEDALAADYVPGFLGNEYIALKKDSRAKVTFNYLTGYPDYVYDYQEGESSSLVQYQLSDDDYASVGGDVASYEMFFAANPPGSYLPGILDNNFPDAAEGDKVLALFDYSEEVSSSPTVEVAMTSEDYQMIVDYVEANIENGSNYLDSYGTTEFYFGAASYYENFDLRLSKREEYNVPGFDGLTTEEGEALMEERVQEGIQIMLQEKYPDAQATIDGNQVYYIITYDTYDGSSGETYNVAYTVKEKGSPATFELVEGPTTDKLAFSSASTISDGIYYRFDGSDWKAEEDVFYLSSEDYNEMGAPGNYDNFSSSEPPENYIPQYLQQQITYAQEGDKVVVGYKYYSGSTKLRAGEYEFNGTNWENTSKIVERTEQFVHNGNEWVFDPTVVFTMSSDDYQLIVDYVQSNIENGSGYVDEYGTTEYYYGASSYYENFDMRLSQKESDEYGVIPGYEGLSTAEAIQLSYDRMTEAVDIMLQEKFPDAVPTVNGVDVHYIVSVDTYENDLSRGHYEYDFKCVSAGPGPEFELISAPDFGGE